MSGNSSLRRVARSRQAASRGERARTRSSAGSAVKQPAQLVRLELTALSRGRLSPSDTSLLTALRTTGSNMWWFQQGLCALPAALVVWSAATFIFAYITAVTLQHVDPFVPYISDTGTVPPERCVFGLMLNISSFLGIATVFVRYKQVQALNEPEDRKLLWLNATGLVLGTISSFGMCIVANFQKTVIVSMHTMGAVVTFGVGALYIFVQAAMSHRMHPRVHGKGVFWLRLGVGLWTSISMLSMLISSCIMYASLPGVDVAKKLHWTPGETGYTAHLISTISEWSLAFSFISFFLTYIRDFQKIGLRVEALMQNNHLYDSTHYNVSVRVHHGETSPLLAGSI
ncbi:hypothetical protein GJAV_G00183000 [Gymnothorax javanicus]|nr:hypothetical protein GJAV_G00183000 [Gymnothorax javanicus]